MLLKGVLSLAADCTTTLLKGEEDWHPQSNGKSEIEEAYSTDTTQQPVHIKASPNLTEHAVVCHWGIVPFLCNTQMIKEFNTASRLMTPLGYRGTHERRRMGPLEDTFWNGDRF